MDLTWVSSQRGWALAAAPCASGLCPRVAATGDGGRTWTALPVPPGIIQGETGTVDCAAVACVSQIRFATAEVGYLFGPALYQTDDGGRTWHRAPSRPVEALEPSAGTVVRVVYDHAGCPGPCDRTVQETTAGSGTWHTLLRIPPGSDTGGVAAQVVRPGPSVIYLPVYGNRAGGAGAEAVIFRSADGGNTWQRLTDPCGGTGQQEHDTAGLAAAPGGFLAVLCLPRSETGATFVLTSTDHGSSWRPPRPVPGGTQHSLSLIAAASPGRLVVATGGVTGGGPFTYRLEVSADGGLRWSAAIPAPRRSTPGHPAPPSRVSKTPGSAGGSATSGTSGPPATKACTGSGENSPETGGHPKLRHPQTVVAEPPGRARFNDKEEDQLSQDSGPATVLHSVVAELTGS